VKSPSTLMSATVLPTPRTDRGWSTRRSVPDVSAGSGLTTASIVRVLPWLWPSTAGTTAVPVDVRRTSAAAEVGH
jgi:hypothetical protein